MIRVLFIANTTSLYGANRSMIELAVALQKIGLESFFFIPQDSIISQEHRLLRHKLEDYGFICAFVRYLPSIHIISENVQTKKLFREEVNERCLIKMQDYVKKWKIDIIHTNSLTHNIGALLSAKVQKPHVWHIREALKEDYGLDYDNKSLYRMCLKQTDKIICISNYVRKIHKEMLQDTNTITLYNGVDIDNYIINDSYKSSKNIYRIIICGLIRKEKGQLEAVRALERLISKYNVYNVYLQIIGDCRGEYGEEIIKFIKVNKLEEFVEIIPFQDNLRELRKAADIALMCSENEAFGRVTIESMLSENLVIGAASGGTIEIIEEGILGYLYQKGNVDNLCKKIYYAITHWREQKEIIVRAKEYAKLNFDSNIYARKIFNVYRELLCEKDDKPYGS